MLPIMNLKHPKKIVQRAGDYCWKAASSDTAVAVVNVAVALVALDQSVEFLRRSKRKVGFRL